MLRLIREKLLQVINDIDAGNSNITEDEAMELAKVIQSYTDRTQKMSKYKACQYLNISRATFDNYVREGLLPRGKKEAGFKELFWIEKDLDEFKRKSKC
jgi:predicted DNA-binding transcriptional regulator AlpA